METWGNSVPCRGTMSAEVLGGGTARRQIQLVLGHALPGRPLKAVNFVKAILVTTEVNKLSPNPLPTWHPSLSMVLSFDGKMRK